MLPLVAGPSSTIAVAETLAGVSLGWRATVTRGGHALRLDHQELFEVLADHIDLLQGLFSGLLSASQPDGSGDDRVAAIHVDGSERIALNLEG